MSFMRLSGFHIDLSGMKDTINKSVDLDGVIDGQERMGAIAEEQENPLQNGG